MARSPLTDVSSKTIFPVPAARAVIRQPLLATETADKFDILINANGGGPLGQAGAAKLGIARALLEFNIELRGKLKELGFLTRDAREHEPARSTDKEGRSQTLPVLEALAAPAALGRLMALGLLGARTFFRTRSTNVFGRI